MSSSSQVARAILFFLIVGMGRKAEKEPVNETEWTSVSAMAKKHTVLPLVLQGVMTLPEALRPPKKIIAQWKNAVISSVLHNEQSMYTQAQVIALLNKMGVSCAVLKGASLAALYPKPELRTLGDIDLLVKEEQCAHAIRLLEEQGYRKHESDHAFHIGLEKDGIYLELHYAMTQFPNSEIGEQIRNKLYHAVDRAKRASIGPYTFPVLSETDQALSLLLHMERHMITGGIGLRQLCDWSIFIGSLNPERLKQEVIPVIKESKLFQFASTLTNVCVYYLGLNRENLKWCMPVSQSVAEALLIDILENGNIYQGELERFASSTFVKGEESSAGQQSLAGSAMKNLSASAKKQFPICQKFPILLPAFWFYIPIRYLYRSAKGTRPKQSIGKIAKYAVKRKKLYRQLELFKK